MKTLKEIETFLAKAGVKFSTKYLGNEPHFSDDKEKGTYRDRYRVTFSRNGKKFSVVFGQSINDSNGGKTPPTPYGVIACLQKYDVGNFEDFCSEFGYDEDSRKAEKVYKAVLDEYQHVCMLFTSDELELMQEIQ